MESDLAEVVLNALKQFAQVCLDSERRLEKRREVMRSERAQIQEKIKQQEKIAAKLLLEGNDCFEELLEGKIDDQEYEETNGKYIMPLTMNIHHAVADGFHLSRFFTEVQGLIDSLV